MTRYQVRLSNDEIINVPADKARNDYELIGKYGMAAVLERVKRSRAFKAANADQDVLVRAIICPNGEEVTQF